MNFKVRKPNDLNEEKELHLFVLKLAEYCDNISRDDAHLDFIEFDIKPSEDIDEAQLKQFVNTFPYIGH